MAQEPSIKQICIQAKAGEFTKTLQLIGKVKIIKQNALNVLIAVSNACYHNPEKCDIESAEKLLNTVVSCMESPEETHLTTYLQSVFHVIKLMCEKEKFEDLTKLENVIIPTFLKDVTLKAVKQAEYTFNMLIKQLSQSIQTLAQAKNKKYNKYILELFKIMLKAKNKLNNPKDLMALAQTCVNQMYHLEATNDQILTLYSILLEVLSSNFGKINEYTNTVLILLVPIFANVLSDVIQSRNFDFATMFVDMVECRVRSFFKQPEYVNSHVMFKAVTALFPTNKDRMQDAMENAKLLLNNFKSNHKNLFYNIICFLLEPLVQLWLFYRNSGLHLWCQLPETTLLNILKFLMEEITCHSLLSPKKCSCGCSISKNYCGALKMGCHVAVLLKSYVDQSENLHKTLFTQLGNWLYYFYDLIKKLKEGSCQKWTSFYSELAGHTYNISVVLYKAKNPAHKGIDLCFLKNSLKLEGTRPVIRPVQTNTFICSALCELESKNENWLGCMGMAALHCLLYTQDSNAVFQNWWIRPKIKMKEDLELQRQTLLSVLYKQSKQLSHIYDVDSLLTKEKKIELLIFELTQYKAMWSSKVSMMAAFEHVSEIADIPTLADVILQIYGDGETQIHNDMSSIFSKVTKSIEEFLRKNKSNSKARLALAVLYYYHFKTAFKETAEKNVQEMEKTTIFLESVKKEDIEPVPKDANDECDIVSAYSNLRLTKFVEILKWLNTCEDHISTIMHDAFEPDILKSISKLLIKVGFEYRLHCFSIKSLQAFDMSIKCAQKISDNETHLFALGFLIESADVKKNFVKDLIAKGDQLAKDLEKDNENGRYDKTLAIYNLLKSKAFLHDDPKQSYEAWQKADKLCTLNEAKDEFQILRAELYIALYKLTKNNCDFIKGEHERQPMTLKLHCANDIVIEMVQKNVLSCYELCVLFDTVYEVAKAYNLMRMPRDLRAYSKHSVVLTQKLVLPLRCVSFLILLTHSDLGTSKFDHCSVKLNGIDDLFCLSQSRPFMVPTEKFDNNSKKLESEVDRCTNMIKELVLDVPQHTRQYSPASPTLTVEGFVFPRFTSHSADCVCFSCLNLELQKLILEKYRLNALVNMHEKDYKVAEEFIAGALRLYKTLNRNFHNYRSKASKLIPEALIPDFEDTFLETYANILYDYSFHICRKGLNSEALKINTKLIQILTPHKMKYVYLYFDALLQRLSYIVPEEKVMESDLEPQPLKDISTVTQTPASKTSKITVLVNGVPTFTPKKRRGKKCLLFADESTEAMNGLIPEESQKSEVNASFAVPKLKGKKSDISIPSTPFFGAEKPKIQIFTDDEPNGSLRTYSRKRTGSIKKQASSETKTNGDSKTKVEPEHLPVVSENSRKKTRGQLLTQKIKESSVQNSTKSISSRLRKNVANELLQDKITIPKIPVTNSETDDNSSVVSESPEHQIAAAQRKVLLEKMRSSAKKAEQTRAGRPKRGAASSELKKTALTFDDNETSSSSSSTSTGAIRKSARNRAL